MEVVTFLKIVFLFLFVYAIVPTAIIRLGRIGAVSRAPKGDGMVTLTFDDGPDPHHTQQILDVLAHYKVKACFFVVGSKAKAYPDLLRRIVQEGHEIGNHGLGHKILWLLGPRATGREIAETNRIVEEITGKGMRFYRPAWGLFNLFSICYCRLTGLQVVLWTYMSWDWVKRATPESITGRVLNRVHDGTILVLHDSDSTPGAAAGGPARVVVALPHILDGLKQRGLQVVPLEKVIKIKNNNLTIKKIMRLLWGKADRLIRWLTGIKDMGDSKSSIWRIALRRYRGKDWTLPGGSVLRHGDYFLELHINNERLLTLMDENMPVERTSIIAMREVLNGLSVLADLLINNKKLKNVDVLLGITLLHRGLGRIGFTVVDMRPGLFRTITGWYERWLLAVFHQGGFKSLKSYRYKLTPKYVVITRQDLMCRYPHAGTPCAQESRPLQTAKEEAQL